jgi:hypothetical protein
MKIEKIAFGGWKNCIQIDNSVIQIIATTDVGPRIVSGGFKGKENLFYNNPAEMGQTGGKEYMGYGGHRLWAAPELAKRTYYPDNFPLEVKNLKDGVRLTSAVETTTGIRKAWKSEWMKKNQGNCAPHYQELRLVAGQTGALVPVGMAAGVWPFCRSLHATLHPASFTTHCVAIGRTRA